MPTVRPLLAAVLFLVTIGAAAQQRVAIVDVTVIDVDAADAAHAVAAHQSVVITGSRISARGPAAKIRIPRDATVIDGSGRFLIPGLWDMHVHTLPEVRRPKAVEIWLPLFVANGVTSVRDMGGSDDALTNTRLRIARERLLSPRLIAAGSAIDGFPPQFGTGVRSPAEARQVVDAHQKSGADFIKPYNLLTREEYFAIIDEAKKVGLPVAGHVPLSLTVLEVSDAGQRSVEHLTDIPASCSTIEAELRQERLRTPLSDFRAWQRARWTEETRAAASHSPARCRALFEHLTRNGTWIVPTLVNKKSALDVASRLRDPVLLQYMEPATRAAWEKSAAMSPATPDEVASRTARYESMLRLTGEANDAHALLLAGTDTGSPFPLVPGFSLHEELAILVESGLAPLQALRSATLSPARYLHRERDLGTVARRRIADLVLLDKNPLEDIRNTQSIAAVILGGRPLMRDALDKILADAAMAAK